MTQQSTERAGRDRSTLALDGDAIGREAARRGPPRAQRPPGRAHGVYHRHVSRLAPLVGHDERLARRRPLRAVSTLGFRFLVV